MVRTLNILIWRFLHWAGNLLSERRYGRNRKRSGKGTVQETVKEAMKADMAKSGTESEKTQGSNFDPDFAQLPDSAFAPLPPNFVCPSQEVADDVPF